MICFFFTICEKIKSIIKLFVHSNFLIIMLALCKTSRLFRNYGRVTTPIRNYSRNSNSNSKPDSSVKQYLMPFLTFTTMFAVSFYVVTHVDDF